MNKEQQLIDQAIDGFQQATDLTAFWEVAQTPEFDGYLTIDTGSKVIRMVVEVKQRAMVHQLNKLAKLSRLHRNTLLLAEHIPDGLKQTLRQTHQNYLDGAGNCHIKVAGVLLFVQGRKAVQPPALQKQPFGKSGLRVLFTLLSQPDSVNASIRELAEQTGVSVGTAQQTIDYLKRAGYLVLVSGKKRKLTNMDKLREQWVSRYATTLKPSLLIGRFRLPKNVAPADWRQLLLPVGSYWSGEAAAAALTGNLRPMTLTLYTNQSRSSLLKTYRLLPDPDGTVEVNELFWKEMASQSNTHVVPPLLIYADLLTIDDPRTTDTARHIYQEYIDHA